MAPKLAAPAAQAANPNLDLASKCDPEDFNSCIFCKKEIDRRSEEYVVMLCSGCGHYPIHRQCLQKYLGTGLAEVKKPAKNRDAWETANRNSPAGQAKGRRCGKGRYGESEGAFPACKGKVMDTQQYHHKQKRNVAPDLANQLRQQVRQKAQQERQARQQPKKKPVAAGKVWPVVAGVASKTAGAERGAAVWKQAQPDPIVPQSVLGGKLPVKPSFLAKASQGLSKSCAKRQNRQNKVGGQLPAVLEGEEAGECGHGPTKEAFDSGAADIVQVETSWDVAQNLMRRYKVSLCHQTLINMGIDKDRARELSKRGGGDISAAVELAYADGSLDPFGNDVPVSIDEEFLGLLLAAEEWGFTHDDVTDALLVFNGNYDVAKDDLYDRSLPKVNVGEPEMTLYADTPGTLHALAFSPPTAVLPQTTVMVAPPEAALHDLNGHVEPLQKMDEHAPPAKGPHRQRPWWPKQPFLNIKAGCSLKHDTEPPPAAPSTPQPTYVANPVTLPFQFVPGDAAQTAVLKHASPPEAAALEFEDPEDDDEDDEARLAAIMANLL